MGQVIGLLAQEAPERPAITHEDRTLSRLELELRTNRLARGYAQLGVGQDDLVTIALPNGIAFYEACGRQIWGHLEALAAELCPGRAGPQAGGEPAAAPPAG